MYALAEAIGLTDKLKDMPFAGQPIQQCSRHDLILECVIMPFSLIVLLVAAILEAA